MIHFYAQVDQDLISFNLNARRGKKVQCVLLMKVQILRCHVAKDNKHEFLMKKVNSQQTFQQGNN